MNSCSHKYGQSTYHFVLVTKCRYKMFRKREHKSLCRDILMQVAKRHRITVSSLAVADEHIHIIATIPPDMSPSKAMQMLKGASSWVLFRANPNFRLRYPRNQFWSQGGTFRSIGDVDFKTVESYVERQNQLSIENFISQEFPTF